MNKAELIQAAIDALGYAENEDYKIAPTLHAEAMKGRVPALAVILQRHDIVQAAEKYEECDRDARKAQIRFKQLSSRSHWAVLVTASVGVLFMLLCALFDNTVLAKQQWLFVLLGVAGVVVGALGTMWIARIRNGGLLEEWMHNRARSETRRLAYFFAVTRPHETLEASDVPIRLLQLEYFRRYQLEVQMAYYKSRGCDHRKSSRKTLALSGWAVFVSMVATGAAGVLGAWWTPLAAIGALAVLGSALSSYASSIEAVNQDSRNAERYARTRESLENIEARLHEVREAVAGGSQEAFDRFVEAIHEQLSLENRQWLSGAEARSAGITALEQSLERLKVRTAAEGDR